MDLLYDLDLNEMKTTGRGTVISVIILLRSDVASPEIKTRMKNLLAHLLPIRSSIKEVIIKTTEKNVRVISRFTWMSPLPLTATVI